MLGTVRLMVKLVLEKQIIIDRYSEYLSVLTRISFTCVEAAEA